MWVLVGWNDQTVIMKPMEKDIISAINQLDNKRRIGLSLFIAEPGNDEGKDERMVIIGGERVNVEYWQANASTPAFRLHDEQASAQRFVAINIGSGVELQYPEDQTVSKAEAIRAALHFLRTHDIHYGGYWIQEA